MESDIMHVCIPVFTYNEWLRVWGFYNKPEDFGLKAIIDHVQSVDDVDDLDVYEVVDKQLFFLSALKHGFSYSIIGK